MSMPHTIYEAKLVQCEDRRDRSLASHNHLMHLPQVESLLKRLMERLRAASVSAFDARQKPTAAGTGATNQPPAFSN